MGVEAGGDQHEIGLDGGDPRQHRHGQRRAEHRAVGALEAPSLKTVERGRGLRLVVRPVQGGMGDAGRLLTDEPREASPLQAAFDDADGRTFFGARTPTRRWRIASRTRPIASTLQGRCLPYGSCAGR
ncbi:hypothetical protein [Methylobacterium nonmethylotrophicum]|uniref:Uncharacterized protein n=1 Tax=Methylobacterium nonmethylotrophicum TaxID=1141884 RepID=A0A4Z0NQ76_9HYPH|nr:hypothetical protein [Methylobacterium nonmethylotrophicum]TGD98363.1 hypothetical protein EU555_16820 [Methylobacterium nonmethylotrophicum]